MINLFVHVVIAFCILNTPWTAAEDRERPVSNGHYSEAKNVAVVALESVPPELVEMSVNRWAVIRIDGKAVPEGMGPNTTEDQPDPGFIVVEDQYQRLGISDGGIIVEARSHEVLGILASNYGLEVVKAFRGAPIAVFSGPRDIKRLNLLVTELRDDSRVLGVDLNINFGDLHPE